MIETEKLNKRYRRHQVLRDVSMSVPTGGLTILVGHNGCGKTTLMKCLLGLAHPDSGRILIGGREETDAAQRARIGYMPQKARYPDNLTGREWLQLVTSVRGSEGQDAGRLIDLFDLTADLDKSLGTLSGGTSQKLSAVVALMYRPDFLLMDEPTAGLDPVSRLVLKDLIRESRDRGCTVLITSHVISEMNDVCDHLIWMADGRIRYAGNVAEVRDVTGELQLERALALLMTSPDLARARPEGLEDCHA